LRWHNGSKEKSFIVWMDIRKEMLDAWLSETFT
jgi:hypothetical protein